MVQEVSDDKSLFSAERKRLQIEHAGRLSAGARLIKLADKISNVRDLHSNPPLFWSRQRRLEYMDWAARVVDQPARNQPGPRSRIRPGIERKIEKPTPNPSLQGGVLRRFESIAALMHRYTLKPSCFLPFLRASRCRRAVGKGRG